MKAKKTALTEFGTGAVRSADGPEAKNARYDLVCPAALASLATTMGDGAVKYGAHNWTKGIPNHNSLNHAMNHLQQYLAGDRSENHLGHAMANIQFIIHSAEKCGCAAAFELLG